MKNKVYFAMGLHFHQPVGNFEKILERSYQDCYRPFLEVFSKYPDIKITFHFSGNLLDYFEAQHPEFLDKVMEFVSRRQIEIMGSGYYEPIFQAIPQADRIGQIEMLSGYCKERFGVRPRGMWVPERVWSPEIIEDFRGCGMEYSILDDIHLIKAGVSRDELYGYFMTGDKERIAIFPSNKTLRYIIPFKPPRETIDNFKRTAKRKKDALFTYGDDGEKFGEWPWTHDWVYKKGWLDNFFKELTRNQDWVRSVTFSEYLDSHPPVKDVEIPEASYEEMLEWSGGSWMNFLSRYPESDQMHKRMWYVSRRLVELSDKQQATRDKARMDEARKELYKGQCNCPYWHGVFGGIYLHHLRNAVYAHLVKADRIIDEVEYKGQDGWAGVKEADFYNHGAKAIILESKGFFVSIDPEAGGVIRELDYKPKSANLVNTLARRRESYHKKILERIDNNITAPVAIHEAIKTMDQRIKNGIFYDRYLRSCLVDHFIDKDLDLRDFADCSYTDRGNFAGAPYIARTENKGAILSRESKVGDNLVAVLKKVCIVSDAEIEISYILKNKGASDLDTFFGTEFNISMPFADSDGYGYEADKKGLGRLDKAGAVSGAGYFSIKDAQQALGVEVMFPERPERIWYFPVMTVSQSERAYDFSYQSSCIFPIWDIRLGSGQEVRLIIKWLMQ